MADPKKDAPNPEEAVEETKPSKGMPQMVILAGFAVIVLAEVIIGYFVLIPSAQTTASVTNEAIQQGIDGKVPSFGEDYVTDPADPNGHTKEPQMEVEIGRSFAHRNPTGAAGQTEIQTFKFALLVNKKDEKEFQEKYDSVTLQIQSAILKIVASSTPKERDDINLVQINNKIRTSVNSLLEKPYVNKVIHTENEKEIL